MKFLALVAVLATPLSALAGHTVTETTTTVAAHAHPVPCCVPQVVMQRHLIPEVSYRVVDVPVVQNQWTIGIRRHRHPVFTGEILAAAIAARRAKRDDRYWEIFWTQYSQMCCPTTHVLNCQSSCCSGDPAPEIVPKALPGPEPGPTPATPE